MAAQLFKQSSGIDILHKSLSMLDRKKSSSIVPMPPGKAMKASANSIMRALRMLRFGTISWVVKPGWE